MTTQTFPTHYPTARTVDVAVFSNRDALAQVFAAMDANAVVEPELFKYFEECVDDALGFMSYVGLQPSHGEVVVALRKAFDEHVARGL